MELTKEQSGIELDELYKLIPYDYPEQCPEDTAKLDPDQMLITVSTLRSYIHDNKCLENHETIMQLIYQLGLSFKEIEILTLYKYSTTLKDVTYNLNLFLIEISRYLNRTMQTFNKYEDIPTHFLKFSTTFIRYLTAIKDNEIPFIFKKTRLEWMNPIYKQAKTLAGLDFYELKMLAEKLLITEELEKNFNAMLNLSQSRTTPDSRIASEENSCPAVSNSTKLIRRRPQPTLSPPSDSSITPLTDPHTGYNVTTTSSPGLFAELKRDCLNKCLEPILEPIKAILLDCLF